MNNYKSSELLDLTNYKQAYFPMLNTS